jgi:hypothetical protein
MIQLNPKLGAPFIAKVCPANPDNLLRQIMSWMPGAAEEDTWPNFRAMVMKDPDMIDACLRWFHVNARGRLERLAMAEPPAKRTAARAKQTREEKRARVADTMKRIEAVMILNHVMPNGLRLRDCTFGYASEVGGAFARIGAMGAPNAVIGRVLSDAEADTAVGEIGPDQIDKNTNGAAARQDQHAPAFLQGAALEAPR